MRHPPVPIVVELLRGEVRPATDTPLSAPRTGDERVVEARFTLRFRVSGSAVDEWDSGWSYRDVGVRADLGLTAQLEFLARSAAEDIIRDLEEAGYESTADIGGVPLEWQVAAELL